MLWDNGSPPGSAVHYPKVGKDHERVGPVLTLATRTVLLNMQPETQGSVASDFQYFDWAGRQTIKTVPTTAVALMPRRGQDLTSFRGKILRMNLDGTASDRQSLLHTYRNGHLRATDYVYALRSAQSVWRRVAGVGQQTLHGRKWAERGPHVPSSFAGRKLPVRRFGRVDDELRYLYNWIAPATAVTRETSRFVQRENIRR